MRLQKVLTWIIVVLAPARMLGQEGGTALLYGDDISVNNSVVAKSTTVFPGDLITTKSGVANLVETGSSAVINENSIVDYQQKSLKLNHGQVQVATSAGMSVRVGCVTITPAEEVTTKFEVLDTDGKIQIAARQGDVIIREGDRKERLPEGQQGSRDDADKCRAGIGSMPAAIGGVLDSKAAILAGAAIVGGLLVWLLIDESGAPLSNSRP